MNNNQKIFLTLCTFSFVLFNAFNNLDAAKRLVQALAVLSLMQTNNQHFFTESKALGEFYLSKYAPASNIDQCTRYSHMTRPSCSLSAHTKTDDDKQVIVDCFQCTDQTGKTTIGSLDRLDDKLCKNLQAEEAGCMETDDRVFTIGSSACKLVSLVRELIKFYDNQSLIDSPTNSIDTLIIDNPETPIYNFFVQEKNPDQVKALRDCYLKRYAKTQQEKEIVNKLYERYLKNSFNASKASSDNEDPLEKDEL